MAAKEDQEAVPVAAEMIEITPQELPQPETPARGGRYRQDPVIGKLVVVPAIEEL